VVSSSVKFPIRRQVKKAGRIEYQTHGYEVDVIGARADRLVLASVKSFLGSRGVQATHVAGAGKHGGLYRLLNDREIRDGVVACAAERYGYEPKSVFVRLYVGKFAGKNGADEPKVRDWCSKQVVGGGPIEVVGLPELIAQVRSVAASKTYVNNPVVVAVKALAAGGLINLDGSVRSLDESMFVDQDDHDDERDHE
jgi:hypothetical protein